MKTNKLFVQHIHHGLSSFRRLSELDIFKQTNMTQITLSCIRHKSDASTKAPKDILLYSNKNG